MEATDNLLDEERALQQENALLTGQKRVLEMIAAGAPVDDTLSEITQFIEAQEEGLRCGILLVNDAGTHLGRGSGPSLSEIYHRALDGVPIAPPYFGPCGHAAHTASPVFVADIAKAEQYAAEWRELLLTSGLRSCFSMPVQAADGRVLACFAIYRDVPRDPRPERPELIEIATHLAGIAIDRARAEATLRERDEFHRRLMQSTQDCIKVLDLDGRLLWMSEGGRKALEADDVNALLGHSWTAMYPDSVDRELAESAVQAAAMGESSRFWGYLPTLAGKAKWWESIATPIFGEKGKPERLLVISRDVTQRQHNEQRLREDDSKLQEQAHRLNALNRVATAMATDLDLDRVIQTVTDNATELSGAQFGAFFYNTIDETRGECFTLHALSGVQHEQFEKFGTPRNTSMFGATFRGEGIVRSADVRQDPRYGQNPPYHGIPEGHPPVASYLAVPVISRSGTVLGGLFLGHGEPGVFDRDTEDLVAGIAAHAAMALDNARLLEAAQQEIERSQRVERAAQQLAAIVESSDDAIISKDLNGIIQTWNKGAEHLFGYRAEEVIGEPIYILIPPDHTDEEPYILDRIRHGESVEHYDTVRQRKDGSLVDISLTVSPIKDATGTIIGASKIARDVTDRRQAERHRTLLVHELSHRVKNSLATVLSIAVQTQQNTTTQADFQTAFMARLIALAHTHDLLMQSDWSGATLRKLIETELEPYRRDGAPRWAIIGSTVQLDAKTALALGMALHELATNAVKYGALSDDNGRIEISWRVDVAEGGGVMLRLFWLETGGPRIAAKPTRRGFGSRLIERGLKHELHARVRLDFDPEGVHCAIDVPFESEIGAPTREIA
ncbi:MAG TPA: PAS domain S-box protein [Gammaproteobacteria bacterium]|nr:PAS domain S-box protein [Gammaproteobacteria bacterium]